MDNNDEKTMDREESGLVNTTKGKHPILFFLYSFAVASEQIIARKLVSIPVEILLTISLFSFIK